MIQHRALEMIHHAEELKRSVVETVAEQIRSGKTLADPDPATAEAVPEGKKVKRAFAYLVKNGVQTEEERREMVLLIGQRNSIAHHLDHVAAADLNPDPWVRDHLAYMPERRVYDHARQAI